MLSSPARRWARRAAWAWVAWRLFGPETVPRFPAGQEHPLRVAGRSLFVGDQEMFVRETGPADAPPVVLIHGWDDHSVVTYGRVIPLLAVDHRVVAVDLRDCGKSDRLRGGFDIEDLADDVAGVLSQLHLAGATVFGYSMGGLVAQALARRHPHLVGKLGLGGTAAAAPSAISPWRPVAAAASVLARAFERLSRSEVSWLRTLYLVRVGAVDPRHHRWFYTQHRNRDPDLYWEQGAAIARFDSSEWIGRLPQPVLVVVTTNDQLMWPSRQRDLVERLRAPMVVEVEARHEAPLTHPEVFADAIRRLAASGG